MNKGLLNKNGLLKYIKHILLISLSAIWIYPFLWMISTSLKTQADVFKSGLKLIPETFHWENYARAWFNASFSTYFINSIVVTLTVVVLTLIITSMSGYALSKKNFVGKRLFLSLLVASMFIPNGSIIIPLYELINKMGLLDSRLGLILVHTGRIPRIFVLLFMGYFAEMPRDLEDAASIDGAGFIRTFFTIMLPIAKPIVATVIIFQFMWIWNEFLFSLVMTLNSPGLRTVSVGIYSFVGSNTIDWTGMAAASTMALLPVMLIFIFMQKYFVRGLSGAVKG